MRKGKNSQKERREKTSEGENMVKEKERNEKESLT
jgi:hypothetical protein